MRRRLATALLAWALAVPAVAAAQVDDLPPLSGDPPVSLPERDREAPDRDGSATGGPAEGDEEASGSLPETGYDAGVTMLVGAGLLLLGAGVRLRAGNA